MQNKIVSGEVIELEQNSVSLLGPNLELLNCSVVSRTAAKGISLRGLNMAGGTFTQQVRLSDFHFHNAHFQNVKFRGEFWGCDFGDWDDQAKSSITNCDFSDSMMHGCRFLNSDMKSIKLPGWPHFCIFNPADAREFVLETNWPGDLDVTLDVYTDVDPECQAIVSNAEILAADNGILVDDLRRLLEQVPGISIN
ncbi:hypothetical protein SAMN05518865_1222 [Duganella sp. CF458]|uniref:hypothetical protein n=1 Tax=Duganella sp. CF458 TaxID=1884368 RepID=UPI0008F07615|nr:hypothetical protein [Duganella sp. CF458]SFG89896.1 hypothetical protein SAMN05518865_1222 [Duganella sp. CF458]